MREESERGGRTYNSHIDCALTCQLFELAGTSYHTGIHISVHALVVCTRKILCQFLIKNSWSMEHTFEWEG